MMGYKEEIKRHIFPQRDYPSVKNDHTTKIRLGKAMTEMGYDHKEHSHVAYYKAVPRKAA